MWRFVIFSFLFFQDTDKIEDSKKAVDATDDKSVENDKKSNDEGGGDKTPTKADAVEDKANDTDAQNDDETDKKKDEGKIYE